ncbi:MAG: hypothetical protein HY608_10095 [Planctomycetes bacterium]|nr:hypothetical protein [Planctomycetota bacterium]
MTVPPVAVQVRLAAMALPYWSLGDAVNCWVPLRPSVTMAGDRVIVVKTAGAGIVTVAVPGRKVLPVWTV